MDITLNTNPITASDLRLLVDSDDDLSDGVLYNPIISVSGNTVTISGLSNTEIPINSTSYFTIVSIDSRTPLPIDIVEFTAKTVNNEYVQLDWQTASKINNDYFTIERSHNATNWDELKTIDGGENSTSNLSYSDVDDKPYSGISYYRLKQTDIDGKFEYSEMNKVNIDDVEGAQIEIYPNPSTNGVFNLTTPNIEEKVSLVVVNALGSVVFEQSNISAFESFELSNQKGMYLIKLSVNGQPIYEQAVIIKE